MGFFGRLAEGLKKTRESMARAVDELVNSFTRIDEELFEELEETLIMSDVGAVTAAAIAMNCARRSNGGASPTRRRSRACSRRSSRGCLRAGRS